MLDDKDMAGLANRLHVPLVVQDVLSGQESLSDDLCYALHDVLADQKPDSALLSIAVAAQKITARYIDRFSALIVLKMEAERVLFEYGQSWLLHARSKDVDDAAVLERLMYLPEDLQAMSELLEVASALLQPAHPEVAELCRIFMVQADAQMLIAESFIDLVHEDEGANDSVCFDKEQPAELSQDLVLDLDQEQAFQGEFSLEGNVVLFPCGSQARH